MSLINITRRNIPLEVCKYSIKCNPSEAVQAAPVVDASGTAVILNHTSLAMVGHELNRLPTTHSNEPDDHKQADPTFQLLFI